MSLKFGTDGIRGEAFTELTPEFARRLGAAASQVLFDGVERTIFIGRDTRESGPVLQAALAAGFGSAGVRVIDLGVIPTPGVAHCSVQSRLAAAMISASHNPYRDNGIKFFLPGGRKLSDEVEEKLEALLLATHDVTYESDDNVVGDYPAFDSYGGHLWEQRDFDEDAAIVIDCANGAASKWAPWVFQPMPMVLFNEPNGHNINDGCGSTHPEELQKTVVETGAACGFAFDGDADRVLAVDHTGALIDGDHILAMLAIDMKSRGELNDDTLVITVMANLGLKLAMEDAGIKVHEVAVGDRYVLEALDAHDWSLGGEQSGHIILPAHATTGDGMLTALKVLAVMKHSGKSLNELAAAVTKFPQVLRNVRVKDRDQLSEAQRVWDAVTEAEGELGKTGRVLLRTSGTEPVVRVMVEAPTQSRAQEICDRLCAVVESEMSN